MFKRVLLALVAMLFVSTAAFAADTVKGTVSSIDGQKVTVKLVGDKADWVKKNAPVKIKAITGKIVEVTGTKDAVIVISTSKASELKVGAEVSIDKGKSMSGC